MLKKATREGAIEGMATARLDSRVSHLFFADDDMIFCRATNGDCLKLLQTSETYEKAYGKAINTKKSGICLAQTLAMKIKCMLCLLWVSIDF